MFLYPLDSQNEFTKEKYKMASEQLEICCCISNISCSEVFFTCKIGKMKED